MRWWGSVALVFAAVAVLAPAAPAASRAGCSAVSKQYYESQAAAYAKGMATARAAYFAHHRSARQRAAFAAAQKQKLAALRAEAACTVTTDPGVVAAPAPASNEHFVFSDELPQAARDEIERDVAYAVQDENAVLGTQFADVTIFASTEPAWLGRQQCDFLGHSDDSCYSQVSARFAGGNDAGEGYTGGLSLNWGQGWASSPAWQNQKVIAHELFHVLQFQLGRLGDADGSTPPSQVRPSGPVWMLEGAAEVVGYRVADDRRMHSYKDTISTAHIAWHSGQPTLDQIQTLDQSNANGAPYSLYMLAVDHLVALAPSGLRSLAAYYEALGNGAVWQNALAQAFGTSVDAFYANFATYRAAL